MSKRLMVSATILFLLVSVSAIAMALPLRMIVGEALSELEYTDLHGATLLSGDLWLNIEGVSGLAHLTYGWCPGLSPLSWCIDVAHSSAVFNGQLSITGMDQVSVSNLHISSIDMASLGIASGLVDARVTGYVNSMDIGLGECLLTGISNLDAELEAASVGIFGVAAGAHQLQISTSGSGILGELSGQTFSGQIQIMDAAYSANGEMLAPESVAGMVASLMRPLGGNRFGWEISGNLPC